MRLLLAFLCLLPIARIADGAAPPDARFDVHINVADQRELHSEFTLPEGAAQQPPIDADLTIELRPWKGFGGGRWFEAVVIRSVGGEARAQSVMQRPSGGGSDVVYLAFSVCGARIIAVADALPGRCADLPALAVPYRIFGSCGVYCTGPYEGMPTVVTTHARIAPAVEPGEPLVLTGRVLGANRRPGPLSIRYDPSGQLWRQPAAHPYAGDRAWLRYA